MAKVLGRYDNTGFIVGVHYDMPQDDTLKTEIKLLELQIKKRVATMRKAHREWLQLMEEYNNLLGKL